MKLSCLQENLSRGLAIVSRAVTTRAALPITQNVLISTDQSMLKLSATNLEIAITTWVGAMIEEEGQLVIGSIEVVLDNLIITASDINGVGSDDFITLGMCQGCTDNWKYGEDEYDTPSPPEEFTNIYFYHEEVGLD